MLQVLFEKGRQMSGNKKHPPYRLSVNKSVDRYLLLELIRFAEKHDFLDMDKTEYFSLGGPFLIDQKIIHSNFPYIKIHSIERDSNTFERQKRHVFCKNIELIQKGVSDFIEQYEFSNPAVFWLDFTHLSKPHLDSLANLVFKLPVGSIVKITFNGGPPCRPHEKDQSKAVRDFRSKYDDYLGSVEFEQLFDEEDYHNLLVEMIKNAAAKLQKERKVPAYFVCCDVVEYCDTAPMMSFSGILISPERIDELNSELQKCAFFSPNRIQTINMPSFSSIERYYIDQKLPSEDMEPLFEALGYPLFPNETEPFDKTKNILRLYAKFWHKYPEFVRIVP